MSITQLIGVANEMATRLQWLHSVGKNIEDPETYKRLASELLHVSNIIELKKATKKQIKTDYGK